MTRAIAEPCATIIVTVMRQQPAEPALPMNGRAVKAAAKDQTSIRAAGKKRIALRKRTSGVEVRTKTTRAQTGAIAQRTEVLVNVLPIKTTTVRMSNRVKIVRTIPAPVETVLK